MARIRIIKDKMVLMDLDVADLMSYLWLGAGRAPAYPFTIQTEVIEKVWQRGPKHIENLEVSEPEGGTDGNASH